jgi:hypothetical protein
MSYLTRRLKFLLRRKAIPALPERDLYHNGSIWGFWAANSRLECTTCGVPFEPNDRLQELTPGTNRTEQNLPLTSDHRHHHFYSRLVAPDARLLSSGAKNVS